MTLLKSGEQELSSQLRRVNFNKLADWALYASHNDCELKDFGRKDLASRPPVSTDPTLRNIILSAASRAIPEGRAW